MLPRHCLLLFLCCCVGLALVGQIVALSAPRPIVDGNPVAYAFLTPFVNDSLLFVATNGTEGRQLWYRPANSEVALQITNYVDHIAYSSDVAEDNVFQIGVVGNRALFLDKYRRVHSTDGLQVYPVGASTTITQEEEVGRIMTFGGKALIFFQTSNSLYVTDGVDLEEPALWTFNGTTTNATILEHFSCNNTLYIKFDYSYSGPISNTSTSTLFSWDGTTLNQDLILDDDINRPVSNFVCLANGQLAFIRRYSSNNDSICTLSNQLVVESFVDQVTMSSLDCVTPYGNSAIFTFTNATDFFIARYDAEYQNVSILTSESGSSKISCHYQDSDGQKQKFDIVDNTLFYLVFATLKAYDLEGIGVVPGFEIYDISLTLPLFTNGTSGLAIYSPGRAKWKIVFDLLSSPTDWIIPECGYFEHAVSLLSYPYTYNSAGHLILPAMSHTYGEVLVWWNDSHNWTLSYFDGIRPGPDWGSLVPLNTLANGVRIMTASRTDLGIQLFAMDDHEQLELLYNFGDSCGGLTFEKGLKGSGFVGFSTLWNQGAIISVYIDYGNDTHIFYTDGTPAGTVDLNFTHGLASVALIWGCADNPEYFYFSALDEENGPTKLFLANLTHHTEVDISSTGSNQVHIIGCSSERIWLRTNATGIDSNSVYTISSSAPTTLVPLQNPSYDEVHHFWAFVQQDVLYVPVTNGSLNYIARFNATHDMGILDLGAPADNLIKVLPSWNSTHFALAWCSNDTEYIAFSDGIVVDWTSQPRTSVEIDRLVKDDGGDIYFWAEAITQGFFTLKKYTPLTNSITDLGESDTHGNILGFFDSELVYSDIEELTLKRIALSPFNVTTLVDPNAFFLGAAVAVDVWPQMASNGKLYIPTEYPDSQLLSTIAIPQLCHVESDCIQYRRATSCSNTCTASLFCSDEPLLDCTAGGSDPMAICFPEPVGTCYSSTTPTNSNSTSPALVFSPTSQPVVRACTPFADSSSEALFTCVDGVWQSIGNVALAPGQTFVFTSEQKIVVNGDVSIPPEATMQFDLSNLDLSEYLGARKRAPLEPILIVTGNVSIQGNLTFVMSASNVDSIGTTVLGPASSLPVPLVTASSISSNQATFSVSTQNKASGEAPCESTTAQPDTANTAGNQQQLNVIFTVDSTQCNQWWVILAPVLGFVVIGAIVVVIVALKKKPCRKAVLPYRDTEL